ncbi:MAG: chemotaxis response regulator protein-glutamate methylesterase [Pseudomonadota bacterium]
MNQQTRVLVVDDSSTMRSLIRAVLETDPMIAVVGEAHDAPSARDMISTDTVDVVTLDVEMPGMNGLEFLERIMRFHPMPVIMVSQHTQSDANATVEALARGAFGCVAKPNLDTQGAPFGDLVSLVHAAARANSHGHNTRATYRSSPVAHFQPGDQIVAIGASIGGVEALSEILSVFPRNCPPTVITQHMPEGYTENFAERLDRTCAPIVQQATDNALLEAGHIYLAPGGEEHLEIRQQPQIKCILTPGEKMSGHCPSIDRLFFSCAALGARVLGVILTGMGKDGASGLLKMREAGAHTIGQSADTCVVHGIAKAATMLGAVEEQIALEDIAKRILVRCSA